MYVCVYSIVFSVFKSEGVLGGNGLGGACVHIKALDPIPFLNQNKICTEGMLGQYPLSMLERTLFTKHICDRIWENPL